VSYTLYTLKAASRCYSATARSAGDIKYIVVHYTGNHGDTAKGNATYFSPSGSNTRSAGAHYFVDDTAVYSSVPDLYPAWSVGDKANGKGTMYGTVTNRNSLNIEMCGTGTGTEASEATICNAVALIKALQAKYGIANDHIYRHYDVTTKQCPAWLVSAAAWAAFKKRFEEEVDMTKAEVEALIDERVAAQVAALTTISGTGDAHSSWADAAVEYGKSSGLFAGDGSGNYGWKKLLTREQLAEVMRKSST
jgi:N-acetylmuramoyl-L-alanine amidase CwlA